MSLFIGIDIGGTKIACAIFDEKGRELARVKAATPQNYNALLQTCASLVAEVEEKGSADFIGVCAPYADAHMCSNMPCLVGKDLRKDLKEKFARPVAIENDANCAALAEALEGAGRGFKSVVCVILGTGVGSGFVVDGRIMGGANGISGEIGHLPLPGYDDSDGPLTPCNCGQKGCIETFVSGSGLRRLHETKTGHKKEGRQIAELAQAGDASAATVLDHYATLVAKAMVAVLHTFDPEIIVISGGLSALPFYDDVPRRWGQYATRRTINTLFKPALLGPVAGLRGAALLGKKA